MDRFGPLHDQPRSPARRRRPQKGAPAGDELEDPERAAAGQALGRSCGGLTTKVHLACDGRGLPLAVLPLAVLATPGNVNDSTAFDAVPDALPVPRTGVGRPRRRPDAVIADKAYSSRSRPSRHRAPTDLLSRPSARTRTAGRHPAPRLYDAGLAGAGSRPMPPGSQGSTPQRRAIALRRSSSRRAAVGWARSRAIPARAEM